MTRAAGATARMVRAKMISILSEGRARLLPKLIEIEGVAAKKCKYICMNAP
jgi:hypothetical protein